MSRKSRQRWQRPDTLRYAGQTNYEAALAIKKGGGENVVLTRRPTGLMAIMATDSVYDDVLMAILLANKKEMQTWM